MMASTGRPDTWEITEQSCHSMPRGTPIALATASLTANRPASEAADRGAPLAVIDSAGVNSRRPATACAPVTDEPFHRDDVDADPNRCPRRRQPAAPAAVTGDAYSTVTDLARFRGLSMS